MSFEEAKKLDDHFVMHTFARKPVLLVEGSGMEVKDDEGKTYLDFIAGIGVGLGTGFAGMSACRCARHPGSGCQAHSR